MKKEQMFNKKNFLHGFKPNSGLSVLLNSVKILLYLTFHPLQSLLANTEGLYSKNMADPVVLTQNIVTH